MQLCGAASGVGLCELLSQEGSLVGTMWSAMLASAGVALGKLPVIPRMFCDYG